MKYLILFFLLNIGMAYACPELFAVNSSKNESQKIKEYVLNADGSPKPEYIGMDGYALLSKELFKGNMIKTYTYTLDVLGKKIFGGLKWQQFEGSVPAYQELKSYILNPDGSIKPEYIGMEGYARLADELFNGDMIKAFVNTSALLSKEMFSRLKYQQFQGTTVEFQELKSYILDSNGFTKKEFLGMEGYIRLADTPFFNGNMGRAFINTSALSKRKLFKNFGWKQFHGTTTQYHHFKSYVLNPDGSIKPEYVGMEGYARLADELFGGKMQKTFSNTSAVFDKEFFEKFKWQAFQGTTTEYRRLKNDVLNPDDSIKSEYVGMEGCVRLADELFGGDMLKTFRNISVLFDKEFFERFKWQTFRGTTAEFQELKSYIQKNVLKPDGSVKEEYIGMEGYVRLAETPLFGGNMMNTFANISAILDKEVFLQFEWKKFMGSANQFHLLIEDFIEHYSDGRWQGLEGQVRIGDKIFNTSYYNTYRAVSVLRDYFFSKPTEFTDLGWIMDLK